MISNNKNDLMKVCIGQRQPYLPKPELKYKEYIAIKNYFNGAEFERNSVVSMIFPFTASILWFMKRVGGRMKWF